MPCGCWRPRCTTAASLQPRRSCGVTQAAISRQIALLERELGTVLFVRRHRAVEPTPACQMLAASLALSFASIAEFRERYPSAQIRIVSQDARLNLAAGEVDALVRFGVPPFDDGRCELIGQDIPDRSGYTWADWFDRAGLTPRHAEPALRFNHYTKVLQAARAGHGVALGWHLLVQNHLADGSLVRLGQASVFPEGRYNLLLPTRRKTHPMRDIFVEWLAGRLSQPTG
ncbi:LysR family transcriptional regulator [Ideonella livida]|uniref:LysR family transcriptional regulator n=1 Tax=Ideonella livida TaxID=2707176 RepID=UPI00194035A0|nr:LysR substrate-binding domain-containing protein [Ideonella livida]